MLPVPKKVGALHGRPAASLSRDQCARLDAASLDNRALLRAIYRLCWLRDDAGLLVQLGRAGVVGLVDAVAQAHAADLKTQAKRGQGVHWILQQRPVTGSLEATKEALRNETLKKKIDGYLILDPSLLEKSQAEYCGLTVSEFVAMAQLDRAINHVMLKEKICSSLVWMPCEAPFTFNSICGKLEYTRTVMLPPGRGL